MGASRSTGSCLWTTRKKIEDFIREYNHVRFHQVNGTTRFLTHLLAQKEKTRIDENFWARPDQTLDPKAHGG